jgi:hypothetical protein
MNTQVVGGYNEYLKLTGGDTALIQPLDFFVQKRAAASHAQPSLGCQIIIQPQLP